MHIILGALVGILGFLPIFFAIRQARRTSAANVLALGLQGLAGVCVSLVILVVGLVACGIIARPSVVGFAIAETVLFLGCTIAYVVVKGMSAKRRHDEDFEE